MWMSDRPRTQQQLARDLASLVDDVRPSVIIPFLDAFWKTMAREWVGIDALRCERCLRFRGQNKTDFLVAGWTSFSI